MSKAIARILKEAFLVAARHITLEFQKTEVLVTDKNVKSPSLLLYFIVKGITLNVCSASDGVWGTDLETRILRLFIVQQRISRGFSEPGKTGKRA